MPTMSETDRQPFRLETDLLSLRALVAIVDEGGFSAAARRVNRSQSAVSLQVAKLEERLQTRLLERTSRSVALTPPGETIVAYARRILALADEAATAVTAPVAAAPLRVGVTRHVAPRRLNGLFARFHRGHPGAPLSLQIDNSTTLLEQMRQGELDIVISAAPAEGARLILREPLAWVGPALAERAEPLRGGGDDPLSLVLLKAPCAHRVAAFDALTSIGKAWRLTMETNAAAGLISAVSAGLGVSVLPRSAVTDEVRVLGAPMPPLPDAEIFVVERGDDAHPLAARFIAFLEDGLARETRSA